MIVFTMANRIFVQILQNFMAHMSSKLAKIPYEAHAADRTTYAACRQSVRTPGTCILSPHETRRGHNTYYRNPFYIYKVRLLVTILVRSGGDVIMLDATALVLTPSCIEEWMHFQEDIITSSSNSHPSFFARRYGITANSGAILFRQNATAFAKKWLASMTFAEKRLYKVSGSKMPTDDQWHLAYLLWKGKISWANGTTLCRNCASTSLRADVHARATSSVASVEQTVLQPLRIRFLSYLRWPRLAAVNACLYHPYVHSNRAARFTKDGHWYLSSEEYAAWQPYRENATFRR